MTIWKSQDLSLRHQSGPFGKVAQLGYDAIGVDQAKVADFNEDKAFGGVRIGPNPMNQAPPKAVRSAENAVANRPNRLIEYSSAIGIELQGPLTRMANNLTGQCVKPVIGMFS